MRSVFSPLSAQTHATLNALRDLPSPADAEVKRIAFPPARAREFLRFIRSTR